MGKPRILIILASIREGRVGEPIARWMLEMAKQRSDFTVEWVDLKDWPLPLYAHAESPKKIEAKYTDPLEQHWVEKVRAADGFLVVTPEYNHGYPPGLKNALDYAYWAWNHKPIAFVSYGAVGGARSVEQLRLVAVDLQLVPTRDAVHLPLMPPPFGPDGKPTNPFTVWNAEVMLNQLGWYAGILKNARERSAPPPPPPPPTR